MLTTPPPRLLDASLVHRTKLDGRVGRHYGVLLRAAFMPDVVIDRDDKGVHIRTVEEFAAGRPLTLERRVESAIGLQAVAARLARVRTDVPAYDVASANCEHFARWIAGGQPESRQVGNAVAALVSAGFILAMFAR